MNFRKYFHTCMFISIALVSSMCSDDLGGDWNPICDVTDESTFSLGISFPDPRGDYSTCDPFTPISIPADGYYYDSDLPPLSSAHYLDVEVIGFTSSGCSDRFITYLTDKDDLNSQGQLIVRIPTEIEGEEVIEFYVSVQYFAECGSGNCHAASNGGFGNRLYWYAEEVYYSDIASTSQTLDMGQPQLKTTGCD